MGPKFLFGFALLVLFVFTAQNVGAKVDSLPPQILVSWGANDQGQLLQNNVNQYVIPTTIDPNFQFGENVSMVASGQGFACALVQRQTSIYCWGSNFYGCLGNNSTQFSSLTPVLVNTPSSVLFTSVAASLQSVAALTSDGYVFTWGDNSQGQLGYGLSPSKSLYPIPVYNTTGVLSGIQVSSVECGDLACAAVVLPTYNASYTSFVVSWGSNALGQLGYDTGGISVATQPGAVNVTGPLKNQNVTMLVAGLQHFLAYTSSGVLAAWGSNLYGQLGTGTTSSFITYPVSVNWTTPVGDSVIQLAAGKTHSLILLASGDIYGWGNSYFGQLGIVPFDRTVPYPYPLQLQWFWGNVDQIGAIGASSFFLSHLLVNTFYGTGDNSAYILGINSTYGSSGPVKVDLTAVTEAYPNYQITGIACTTASASSGFAFASPFPAPPPTEISAPQFSEPPPFTPPVTPMQPITPFIPLSPSPSGQSSVLTVSTLLALILAAIQMVWAEQL